MLAQCSQRGTRDRLEQLLHPKTKRASGVSVTSGIGLVGAGLGCELPPGSAGCGGVLVPLAGWGFGLVWVFVSDFYIW